MGPCPDEGWSAPGLRRAAAVMLPPGRARWELTTVSGMPTIALHGELSGHLSVGPLARLIRAVQVLDVGGIARVTGAGARWWVELLRGLPDGLTVRLCRVGPPLARWLLGVPAMGERCRVESVVVAYTCTGCRGVIGEEHAAERESACLRRCPACGCAMLAPAAALGLLAAARSRR